MGAHRSRGGVEVSRRTLAGEPAATLPGLDAAAVAKGRARKAKKARRPGPPDDPAPHLPVARVAVDTPLPHLDRPFDYLVTAKQDATAVPGCRVRVRFAGQLLDGYLLERVATSEHQQTLKPLNRVVSSEPVLSHDIVQVARAVADRYAGTLSDVLRLAIPPRHAAVEKAKPLVDPLVDPLIDRGNEARDPHEQWREAMSAAWSEYTNGSEFLELLSTGNSPRAVWSATPSREWSHALTVAVAATTHSGRGAIVVVPDRGDVEHVAGSLAAAGVNAVVLTAELGPRERYRSWLSVSRGQQQVVVGTRAAAFAPVKNLGLLVVWDDGDDLHAEPRAPYPHAREVAALRAHIQGAALLIGGYARTAEGAAFVRSGFAKAISAPRAFVRDAAPRVRAIDESSRATDPLAGVARLPQVAWRTAKDALQKGPVLIQVPRRGHTPSLACTRCRTRAQCSACHGPLVLRTSRSGPTCGWCGQVEQHWQCPECGHGLLRALAVGAQRTAEELGQAFSPVPVITSSGDKVVRHVSPASALVIATPGAEPVADGGYAAALLLDAWALLGRADLRASEEAVRRWFNASALVKSRAAGGEVVLVADSTLRPVQALIRWDPVGYAARELDDRIATGMPPARRVALLTGAPNSVRDVLDRAALPADAVTLGPTPIDDGKVRALLSVPLSNALSMTKALKGAVGERSARKNPDVVRVMVDPPTLGES